MDGVSCLTSGFIRSGLISAVIIRAGVHNVGSSKTAGGQNGGGCKMPVVAKCRWLKNSLFQ